MIGGHGDTVEFQNRLKELQDLYPTVSHYLWAGEEGKQNIKGKTEDYEVYNRKEECC